MIATRFEFPPTELPDSIQELRREVRAFIAEERSNGAVPRPGNSGMRVSLDFTRKLAQRGWIGMTWPKKYGGHERSALERYAVTEELLSAGAPVRLHWSPDRQTGPLLLKFGTEAQKLRYLPGIAKGECIFSIGLSEPNSGSDLAALQTRAQRVEGGWSVSGTKLWNSNGHNAHYMITLCRTEAQDVDRHRGISQLIVDLKAPGVTIRPIINLAGEHDFNEVVLDGVFVPDESVLGELGNGWNQASAELAYERSGPERWLSAFRLLAELTEALGRQASVHACRQLGKWFAHLLTLRQMSQSIAVMLESGSAPNLEAAIVKDLGTNFEQEMVRSARDLIHAEGIDIQERWRLVGELLDHAQMWSMIYTVRGGAKEIMRGVIARGLGLR